MEQTAFDLEQLNTEPEETDVKKPKLTKVKARKDPKGITESAVAVFVHCGMPGNEREADKAKVNVGDADKASFRINKELIRCAEYKAVQSFDNNTRYWLRQEALPFWFRKGSALVPISKIDAIEEGLIKRAADRAKLVKEYLRAYPKAVAAARVRLKEHFDAKEYPAVEAVAAEFEFAWYYLEFSAPSSLKEMKKGLWDQARKKIHDKLVDTEAECKGYLLGLFKQFITHLVDRLSVGADGTPTIFKAASVDNLNAFIAEFDGYNKVANFTELAKHVDQAKKIMAKTGDVEILRDDLAFRADIREQLAKVGTAVGALEVVKPGRRKLVL